MKGSTTCKVCGMDFPLTAEEHHIAQDPQRVGVLANLANTDKAMEYDAFDCPHCECQNIVQERKPLWMPEACDCTESEEEDTDSESEVSEEDSEDSVSTEHMREYLVEFCHNRWCSKCPLKGSEFRCGDGFSFTSSPDSSGYISDKDLERYYRVAIKDKRKETNNE